MKKIAYYILAVTLLFLLFESTAYSANLIFKSGFEQGVTIDSPPNTTNRTANQEIHGSDVNGYTWPLKLGNGAGQFLMINDAGGTMDSTIKNEIVTTTGYDGKSTRALRLSLFKTDGITQNFYIVNGTGEVPEVYSKFRVRFASNAPSTYQSYHNYVDIKEGGNPASMRFTQNLQKVGNGMTWVSKIDIPKNNFERVFEEGSGSVPLGDWSTVEW